MASLAVPLIARTLRRIAQRTAFVVVLANLLLSMVVAQGARAQDPQVDAKLGPILKGKIAQLKAAETVRFSVMIEPDAAAFSSTASARKQAIGARQEAILDLLPANALGELRRYENLPAFAGRGSAAAIKALAAHPWVTSIYADREAMAALAQGVALIGADEAVAAGFSGAGVSVAVIDSGIDTDHPDLVDDLVEERCWCAGSPSPASGCCPNGSGTMSGVGAAEDDSGHGTSVSGVVTSGGVVAGNGVAPDAGIVAIKVLAASGSGSFADVDTALDWIITNHATHNIRAVNLSLSDGTEHANPLAFPCSSSVTSNAIDDLEALGIAVVVASGNDGFDGGIAFPACVPSAISVGGVYDANVGSISWCTPSGCVPALCTDSTTAADQFVCHTNSGVDLDVLAPDWRTHTSAQGGGTTNFGGTSAAAPYVSGLSALLLEQDPSRTPSDLLNLMTADSPLVVNPDSGLSFPRADVSAAFSACGDGNVTGSEDCDDGNVLSGDCCSNLCVFEVAGSACDDADACTSSDQCDGSGSCNQSSPVVCDNGEFCDGTETCDSLLGCQPGITVPVDDGVACTDDSCDEVGDVVVNASNDALCDNGQFCDGTETCDAALDCQPGTSVPVDDGVACTDDSCDEIGDVVVNASNDALCDNGQFCDGTETCDAALDCQPGTSVAVDDGVACTDDSCDEIGDVVVNAANDALCDNGLFCDGDETCDAALDCQAGITVPVDDGVACTDDSCDEIGDVVVNAANDALCDNGQFCDGDETCDAALDCQAGITVPVDDGVACTDDSCDEVGDVVVNAANDALCDNGQFCDGDETCDAVLDCQAGITVPVDDGVACTDDSCNEVADTVVNAPNAAACDDGDPCTAEACDAVTGCSNIAIPGCAVPVPVGGGAAPILLILALAMAGARAAVPRRS